jgi:integrase
MRGFLQKKSDKYYVVFDLERDPVTGKRQRKWLPTGTGNKKEAEKKWAEMMKNINTGDYIEPADLSLCEYLKQWLEHYRHSVRPSTYDSYSWAINKHLIPGLGSIPLGKLKPLHIQTHLTKQMKTDLSPTSVRYQYNILREALTQAMKWQMIATNPCMAIDPPRKEKYKSAVYTPEQLQLLLAIASESKIFLPLVLAATCGLRRGEICGLRWQEVDLDRGLLFVRNSLDWENSKLTLRPVKTANSERSVKLPTITLEALKKEKRHQAEDKLRAGGMYEEGGYVWAWDDGRPHDPDYLYHRFIKLIKKHNISIEKDEYLTKEQKQEQQLPVIRFHDLRHSHATALLLEGISVKVISERLGHSSTKITQDIYSHVLPQMQEQAADVMDKLLAKSTK